MPFALPASEGTVDKYRISGYRYLTFCWRGYTLGRATAEKQLGVVFTDQQWHCMTAIARAVGYEEDGSTANGRSNRLPRSPHNTQVSISSMCNDEDYMVDERLSNIFQAAVRRIH